jgi:hypothetical protein
VPLVQVGVNHVDLVRGATKTLLQSKRKGLRLALTLRPDSRTVKVERGNLTIRYGACRFYVCLITSCNNQELATTIHPSQNRKQVVHVNV